MNRDSDISVNRAERALGLYKRVNAMENQLIWYNNPTTLKLISVFYRRNISGVDVDHVMTSQKNNTNFTVRLYFKNISIAPKTFLVSQILFFMCKGTIYWKFKKKCYMNISCDLFSFLFSWLKCQPYRLNRLK